MNMTYQREETPKHRKLYPSLEVVLIEEGYIKMKDTHEQEVTWEEDEEEEMTQDMDQEEVEVDMKALKAVHG